jgi:hypothetical protein
MHRRISAPRDQALAFPLSTTMDSPASPSDRPAITAERTSGLVEPAVAAL